MPSAPGATPSADSSNTAGHRGGSVLPAAGSTHVDAQADALHRVLFSESPDAVLVAGAAGQILDANPAARRLLGYARDELVRLRLEEIITPGPGWIGETTARPSASGSWTGEAELRTRGGAAVPTEARARLLDADDGEAGLTVIVFRDLSERKALDETRARLAAMVHSSADAIVGETLDGIVTDWNPAAERLYGYRASQIIGRSLLSLIAPERMPEAHELLARARAGESIEGFETVRYTRDGRRIDVSLTVSPVHNEAGQIIGTSAFVRDITERKEAEAELAATHQHARQILERITDGFSAIDRDWRFTYVNKAAETIFGRPRGELLGAMVWEEFARAVDTPIYDACQQAMADGQTTTVEFFYPPLDAWFEVRLYPSPDGLSAFFRNVNETRRLTQELRASEARYRTLVEHLPAVVYLLAVDEAQSRLYFSPFLEQLTGYTPREAILQAGDEHWLTVVHPDDRQRVAAADEIQNETGGPFRVEYRLARKEGGYVWVRDECVPVFDDSGQIVAWQGVLIDISQQVAAEEAQARLAAIVESAEVAIISRTLDGTITSWNQGAEQLYGRTAEQMIGQSIASLLSPDDPRDALVSAEELAERSKHYEARRYRADGSVMETAITLSPVRDRNGAIVGVSSIARDITARKRAEAELRAALEAAQAGIRSKSVFLAMMSHELRTPLQAVLGYADFLLNGPPGTLTAEQREDIGYIHQGAGRMVALIEQMLDLSRMEAGRLELGSEPVDPREILEQVRQDIAPRVRDKALEFSIAVPDAVPPILGDAGRVRQILLNLAGNAVKFTEEGAVRIEAAATRGGVRIAVRDTGIGISREALPGIFEEFRQVDGNLTRRHGGAGLGLAISRRLAEQMGGRISVKSAPGAGSTFTLHLPRAPGRRRPAAKQGQRS